MKKILLGLLLTTTAWAISSSDSVTYNNKYIEGRNPESVNYIKNTSCFRNAYDITGTNTTPSRNTTTPLTSIADCQSTLDSATDTIDWSTKTLDRSLKNGNCEVGIRYKLTLGSGNTIQLQARINSATVASADLVTSDNGTATVNFPCGDLSNAPSLRIAQTAGSSSQAINVSNVYLGAARNIGTVAQASLIGSVSFSSASNCEWSTSTTTPTDPTADADCNLGTATGQLTALATKRPGFTMPALSAGEYYFVATGAFYKATTSSNYRCFFRFSDGTNSTLPNQVGANSDAVWFGNITGRLSLSTAAASSTYYIQVYSDGATACEIDARNAALQISVYRFPSSSEIAVSANQQNTDWADYTPTYGIGSWTTNLAKWRRVGGNMEVQLKATNTTAGSGAYTFSIPSVGATINTTAVPTSTIGNAITSHTLNGGPVGSGNWTLSSNFQVYGDCAVYVVSTTAVSVLCGTAASSAFSATGNAYSDRAAGLGSSAAGAGSSAYATISFSVPINEWKGMNAPILVGSVTSNSTGALRVEYVRFGGSTESPVTQCTSDPCTIYSQSGSWLTSVSRASTGRYTLNIASGIFADKPTCTANPIDDTASVDLKSASATSVAIRTNDGSATARAEALNVMCIGPR